MWMMETVRWSGDFPNPSEEAAAHADVVARNLRREVEICIGGTLGCGSEKAMWSV